VNKIEKKIAVGTNETDPTAVKKKKRTLLSEANQKEVAGDEKDAGNSWKMGGRGT